MPLKPVPEMFEDLFKVVKGLFRPQICLCELQQVFDITQILVTRKDGGHLCYKATWAIASKQ